MLSYPIPPRLVTQASTCSRSTEPVQMLYSYAWLGCDCQTGRYALGLAPQVSYFHLILRSNGVLTGWRAVVLLTTHPCHPDAH